ncbi:hypothetical protein LCGC14_2345720 [marine sediment metagenome]|uniref:Uncharacterized protein n=1 Tax=marine sediment metagenome TaxID=412755 RepID=A0A0F9CY74_9ZZZZ
MSSELMIHQGAKRLTGRVNALKGSGYTVVGLHFYDADQTAGADDRITIYINDNKVLEAVLVFHKIAQELAALLPDVEACCKCEPGSPDDQCPEHGFGAYKIKRGQREAECDADCAYDPPACPCYQAGTEAERRPLSY